MAEDTDAIYTGTYELEFERPLIALERQIAELELHQKQAGVDLSSELRKLRDNHTAMLRKTYEGLTPWNTVQVARHPGRPQTIDYLRMMVNDFCELHGDRHYGDDPAIITGFGRIGANKVLIVAHHKGRDTKDRIACHFGCAHPEGYRKALLKMKLAEKFKLPIVTLIDTPGAYPGLGAEERGQAEAIAVNLREMSRLKTPIISVVIGEGGSGGALGIGVANKVAMLEHAWYSVISPEGCAAILWKTGAESEKAAVALKLTASDNLKNGIVDHVLEEPLGGAHRNPKATNDTIEKWITKSLKELSKLDTKTLVDQRFERLRKIGEVA
jgi:acetyl-CoA carboxylase carboxyl transferase subunit alpha